MSLFCRSTLETDKMDKYLDIPPTHVRFSPLILDDVLEWVRDIKHIISREVGKKLEKEHHHMLLSGPTIDAITKRFQRICKAKSLPIAHGKANSYYGSIKSCTDILYVCKEGNIVSYNGYTQDEVNEYVTQAMARQEKIDESIEKKNQQEANSNQSFESRANKYIKAYFDGPHSRYVTVQEIRTWLKFHQVIHHKFVESQASNARIVDTIYIMRRLQKGVSEMTLQQEDFDNL